MRLPNHVGLIIDGNRRWAIKRGLQKWEGHKYGAEKLEEILIYCSELKISQISVYLLSTENLTRPKVEVDEIVRLLCEYLQRSGFFQRYGIRVRVFGDRKKLSPKLVEVIDEIMIKTVNNKNMILNLLIGYGGRLELIEAIKKVAKNAMEKGQVAITLRDVERSLYVPTPVDLIIRTGGRSRLSNFMLWQSSYAEIYVTETLWPDFSKEELLKSIEWFNTTQRNFGK